MPAQLIEISTESALDEGAHDRAAFSTVRHVIAAQQQLSEVVRALSDQQYRQKPVDLVPSSIGGHVRHCLDHVEALLVSVATGELNYDHRERGTNIEVDRRSALGLMERQEGRLLALADMDLELPLRLTARLSPSASPVVVVTTLGRELAFILSHTVHHSALVAVMVKLLGSEVPERFGYAPATIAYLEQSRCAQ